MGIRSLFILSIFCYVFGISLILFELYRITKNTQIKLISVVNLFYSIVYGIAPGSVYIHMYHYGEWGSPLAYIDFSELGIQQLWIAFALSVLGLFFLNLGTLKIIKTKKNDEIKQITIPRRSLYLAAVFLLVVSTVSLYLWTRVYGGPIGILKYANDLRAGRDIGISNSFSFMMKLCQFAIFSSYIFYILYLENRKTKYFIMFIISVVVTMLYLLANSSRMMFVVFFVMIFLISMENKNFNNQKQKIGIYILVAIIALVIISASEPIMSNLQVRNNEEIKLEINILKVLREEFFFPSSSIQVALNSHRAGNLEKRLLIDAVSGLYAWLPSRFRPEGFMQLEILNTLLKSGTTIYGGLPPDLISLCIYDLGYFGIIIIPFIFGNIIKWFQNKNDSRIHTSYNTLIYYLTAFYMLKAVAYADPANVMSNIFYVVMCNYVVRIFAFIGLRKNRI
jgi:oligosaccharide repeat unit polymerase